MSGSVTGRTRANTFLITDDLVKNKEEARSPERLEKLYSDYTATLTTRMIGDSHGYGYAGRDGQRQLRYTAQQQIRR